MYTHTHIYNSAELKHKNLPKCESPSLSSRCSRDEGCHGYRGRGKKIITPRPTLPSVFLIHMNTPPRTHIYIYISPSFSHPGSADVTSGTMNLTCGSGDSYLGCGKSVKRRREEKEHEPRRLMAAPAQRP